MCLCVVEGKRGAIEYGRTGPTDQQEKASMIFSTLVVPTQPQHPSKVNRVSSLNTNGRRGESHTDRRHDFFVKKRDEFGGILPLKLLCGRTIHVLFQTAASGNVGDSVGKDASCVPLPLPDLLNSQRPTVKQVRVVKCRGQSEFRSSESEARRFTVYVDSSTSKRKRWHCPLLSFYFCCFAKGGEKDHTYT
jgi:hypothetical protein